MKAVHQRPENGKVGNRAHGCDPPGLPELLLPDEQLAVVDAQTVELIPRQDRFRPM